MNRLRGHFQEVQKRERDGCKVKFEIHSVSTIYFYLPLNEIDFFLGMCTLPFQTATSEERKMQSERSKRYREAAEKLEKEMKGKKNHHHHHH